MGLNLICESSFARSENPMAEALDYFAAVLVALIAVAGYGVTAKYQRDFEKRKINYQTKLTAYTRMTDTASGATANLIHFMIYLTDVWSGGDRNALDQAMIRTQILLSLTREDEKVVGAEAVKMCFDDLEALRGKHPDESEEQLKSYSDWIRITMMRLILLRVRLAIFHAQEFAKAFAEADIVTDNDDVEKAAGELFAYFNRVQLEWGNRAVIEGVTLETVLKENAEIDKLHKVLRDKMWADLDETL
jgi:hypothetical protein